MEEKTSYYFCPIKFTKNKRKINNVKNNQIILFNIIVNENKFQNIKFLR